MRLLSIDGNVGSGKSTLLEKVKAYYKGNANIVILPEPVTVWDEIKDRHGLTMLQKFYSDQDTYAFSFQMMAYISRLALIRQSARSGNPNLLLISERCLFTDKYVFAKMLYDQGKMEEVNFQIYMKWFDEFAQDYPIEHCIYIRTDPAICCERVKSRARLGENAIPLEYLNQCHLYHEEYIKIMPDTGLTVLNGNIDIFENKDYLQQCLQKIDALIYTQPADKGRRSIQSAADEVSLQKI